MLLASSRSPLLWLIVQLIGIIPTALMCCSVGLGGGSAKRFAYVDGGRESGSICGFRVLGEELGVGWPFAGIQSGRAFPVRYYRQE